MPDVDQKSDLLIGIMNIGEMELHAHFSYMMTQDEKWIDIKDFCRKLRAKYMPQIEREENSQLHCFNKHTLSACFRLMEVGDKALSSGSKKDAMGYYADANELFSLFVSLNFLDKGEEKGMLAKLTEKVFG